MHVFHRHSPAVGAQSRRFLTGLFLAVLLVALVPLAVLAVSDDGDAAGFIGWTLPLVRGLVHLTSLAVIAVLCVGVLLPTDDDGEALSPPAVRLGRRGKLAALAAVVACLLLLLWTYFDVVGAGPLEAGFGDFGLFLNQLASGRALIAQIGLLLVCAVIAGVARTLTALRMALFCAVAGSTTLALGGHAASESGHGLAMFSTTAHIGAASLWAGGLAGLGWLALTATDLLHGAVQRFSRLALICAAVVGVSGVTSALVQVPDPAVVPSLYGLVLLLKVLALAGLIWFGSLHRRRLLGREIFTRSDFLKLAAGELVVMGGAYGLAIALVGMEPPALS